MKASFILIALVIGSPSLAAQEQSSRSKDEIAKELAKPNTAHTSLKLQMQYFSFDGDLPRVSDQNMFKFFFRPTLPFPFKNGKTLWIRPGAPFLS